MLCTIYNILPPEVQYHLFCALILQSTNHCFTKKALSLILRNLRYATHNYFKILLFAHPCIWYISTTININSLTIKNTKPAYDNVKKSSEMKQMAQSVS